MKLTGLFASLVFLLCSSGAIADEGFSAPLGLKWGQSQETLTKDYGATPAAKNDNRLKIFLVSNPPIKVSGFDEFYGVIDDKYGLVKVIVIENIDGDAYGSKGLEEYKKIKEVITKKYGKPISKYEYSGRELYKENDEFYQCLAYQGCGSYSSFFKPAGGGDVAVSLKGERRGKGYLSVDYESVLFSNVLNEQESDSKSQAEQGL